MSVLRHRGEKPFLREIAEGVGTDEAGDVGDAVGCGDELLALRGVDAVVAGAGGRGGRPGMLVIQTFGSSLKWNPDIRALVTRGVFLDGGSWFPNPYVDTFGRGVSFVSSPTRRSTRSQTISL
ncbi:MAG TPA: hypothetical protein VGC53_19245 [Vicinamibacteria bacterium]